MTKIRGRQILDDDFISEDELQAKRKDIHVGEEHGYSNIFPINVTSTSSSSSRVESGNAKFENWQVQSGDIVEIIGGNAAGDYTVDNVISQTILTVNENLPDSTSGDLYVWHPAGSTRLGVDDSLWINLTGDTAQEIFNQIDLHEHNSNEINFDDTSLEKFTGANVQSVIDDADSKSFTTEDQGGSPPSVAESTEGEYFWLTGNELIMRFNGSDWLPANATPVGSAGGDLDGYYPDPTVADFTISNQTMGSTLYNDGNKWVQLSPGNESDVLTMGADVPEWSEGSENGTVFDTDPDLYRDRVPGEGISTLAPTTEKDIPAIPLQRNDRWDVAFPPHENWSSGDFYIKIWYFTYDIGEEHSISWDVRGGNDGFSLPEPIDDGIISFTPADDNLYFELIPITTSSLNNYDIEWLKLERVDAGGEPMFIVKLNFFFEGRWLDNQ